MDKDQSFKKGTTICFKPDKTIFSGDVLDSKGNYSAGMFKNSGWKASKEFPKDSLPKATNIWYGFYKQKDIELRFYNGPAT